MNVTVLMGNLGQDPEVKTFGSGKSVCNFSIATNRGFTNANGEKIQETTWHNCVAWEKTGEIIAKFFKKGSKILVRGRAVVEEWETDGGEKRKSYKVVVEEFGFVDSKEESNGKPSERSAQQKAAESTFDLD